MAQPKSLKGQNQHWVCSPICSRTRVLPCPRSPTLASHPHGDGNEGLRISVASTCPESRCGERAVLGGGTLRIGGIPGAGANPAHRMENDPDGQIHGDRKESSGHSGLGVVTTDGHGVLLEDMKCSNVEVMATQL